MSNSTRCPHCNLTNWASDEVCKRCKQPLYVVHDATPVYGGGQEYQQANAGGHDYQPSYSTTPVYQPQPYGYCPQQPLRSGLALTSMILGIISLPTSFFLLGLLLAPIGFILGIVGVVKANKQPRVFGGKGFAIAGIVTSCFTFFLIVPIIAAIAIPNLLAARRMANEAAAVKTLSMFYAAEQTYRSTTGAGKCGDANALASVGLVPKEFATLERMGYRFKIEMTDAVNCEVHATPMSRSIGTRSFMISTYDNTLRGADKKGSFATVNDAPLRTDDSFHQFDDLPSRDRSSY